MTFRSDRTTTWNADQLKYRIIGVESGTWSKYGLIEAMRHDPQAAREVTSLPSRAYRHCRFPSPAAAEPLRPVTPGSWKSRGHCQAQPGGRLGRRAAR